MWGLDGWSVSEDKRSQCDETRFFHCDQLIKLPKMNLNLRGKHCVSSGQVHGRSQWRNQPNFDVFSVKEPPKAKTRVSFTEEFSEENFTIKTSREPVVSKIVISFASLLVFSAYHTGYMGVISVDHKGQKRQKTKGKEMKNLTARAGCSVSGNSDIIKCSLNNTVQQVRCTTNKEIENFLVQLGDSVPDEGDWSLSGGPKHRRIFFIAVYSESLEKEKRFITTVAGLNVFRVYLLSFSTVDTLCACTRRYSWGCVCSGTMSPRACVQCVSVCTS